MILKLLILTALVTNAFGGFSFLGLGFCESDDCEYTFECPKDITDLAKRSAIRTGCIQATIPVCKDKNSKIRSIDGSCNHKDGMGAAMDTIDRVIPNAYGDGFGSPRVLDTEGNVYPSAITTVETIHTDEDKPANATAILAFWGQFASHDILDTITGPPLACCDGDSGCPQAGLHPFCMPIVTRNSTTNETKCTNFVRSQPANCTNYCKVRNIFNTNRVTSFYDLSTVYGSNKESETAVRAKVDGMLKTLKTDKGDFLPNSSNGTKYIPLAGDGRVNQQSFLTLIHTIYLRAHNAIAAKLKRLFPKSTDEQLYQQSRKMLISLYQHHFYCNYLPRLLGEYVVKLWNLCTKDGTSKYDSNIEPRIVHEFGTVCNRMGHSLTPGVMPYRGELLYLSDMFSRGDLVLTNYTELTYVLMTTAAQQVDMHITNELSQKLFKNPKTGKGGNLPAINIRRGEDHGTPLYVAFRHFCCLPNATGFDDRDVFGDNGNKLKKIYKNLKDVEPFPGVLAERIKSGLVPETVACFLALQYYRLKYGDRHFYDTSNTQYGWSKVQRDELRKTNLAFTICLSDDSLKPQKDVFMFPSKNNEYVECPELIKNFDFSKFEPSS